VSHRGGSHLGLPLVPPGTTPFSRPLLAAASTTARHAFLNSGQRTCFSSMPSSTAYTKAHASAGTRSRRIREPARNSTSDNIRIKRQSIYGLANSSAESLCVPGYKKLSCLAGVASQSDSQARFMTKNPMPLMDSQDFDSLPPAIRRKVSRRSRWARCRRTLGLFTDTDAILIVLHASGTATLCATTRDAKVDQTYAECQHCEWKAPHAEDQEPTIYRNLSEHEVFCPIK
jgi:hypothetical protein